MFSAVAVFDLTDTSTASCRYFLVILRMRRRHRGGEQRHLLVLGSVGKDAFDVLGEAHLEHLVGLVEHQIVEVGEVERALLQVVDHPTRGTDDHLGAAPQTRQLRAVGRAAVDRQHVDLGQMRAVAAERLGDLQRQLPGRRQHQRLRGLVGGIDLRQDRDGERGGLAGAGLGQADDVGAGHHRRDGGGLDGRRRLVSDVADRPQHRWVYLQVVEGQIGASARSASGSEDVISR